MSNGVACNCPDCQKCRKLLMKLLDIGPEKLKPFVLYMLGCMADEIRVAELDDIIKENEAELFDKSISLPEIKNWVATDNCTRAGISMDQIEHSARKLSEFTKANTPDKELWVYTMLFLCMELSEDPRLTIVLGGILGTLKQPHDSDMPIVTEGSSIVN